VKHFVVLTVAVLVVLMMVCSAGAADFSGKWVNYKMAMVQGDQKMEMDVETTYGYTEEQMGSVEFKDGKAYMLRVSENNAIELSYKAEGDKLIVEVPKDAEEDGITSMEFYFEGNDLVFDMSGEDGKLKAYYRKPQ